MNWNALRYAKAKSSCFPFVVQFPVKGQRVDQLPYFCGTGAPCAYITVKVDRFPSLSTQADWQRTLAGIKPLSHATGDLRNARYRTQVRFQPPHLYLDSDFVGGKNTGCGNPQPAAFLIDDFLKKLRAPSAYRAGKTFRQFLRL